MPATKIETGVLLGLNRLVLTPHARKHKPDKITSLAQSLKEHNQQLEDILVCPIDKSPSPLMGEGGDGGDYPPPQSSPTRGEEDQYFEVLAGVGRKLAEESLGWESARCTILYGLTPYEKLKVTLDENKEREETTPLDEAIIYQAMLDADHDLTQEDLAKRQGMSQPRLNDYLSLTKLKPEVREIIRYLINLKLDHLVQICRLNTPQDQITLAQEADKMGFSVKDLKLLVDQKVGSKKGKAEDSNAPYPTPQGGRMQPPEVSSPINRQVTGSLGDPAGGGAGGESAPDPLLDFWTRLMVNPQGDPPGAWYITYGPHHQPNRKAPPTKGWQFHFEDSGLTPRTTLKRGFQGMADAMGDSRHEQKELDNLMATWGPKDASEMRQMAEAGKRVRLPRNAKEEAELEALSSKGPEAVYAWIYGPDSIYTKKVKGVSWKDMGIKEPLTGCRELLANQRNIQSLDQPAGGGSNTAHHPAVAAATGGQGGPESEEPVDPEVAAMAEELIRKGGLL